MLMIALDGVSPMAKLRSSRNAAFKKDKEYKICQESNGKVFNTCWITPGTNFMVAMNKQLKDFVKEKVGSDPMYKNVSLSQTICLI